MERRLEEYVDLRTEEYRIRRRLGSGEFEMPIESLVSFRELYRMLREGRADEANLPGAQQSTVEKGESKARGPRGDLRRGNMCAEGTWIHRFASKLAPTNSP
jgi:hypothetical protein